MRLSGGAANSDPNASLGGAKSSVEVVDNTLSNLFDQVSGSEICLQERPNTAASISITAHASLTMQNVRVYISSNTSVPTIPGKSL